MRKLHCKLRSLLEATKMGNCSTSVFFVDPLSASSRFGFVIVQRGQKKKWNPRGGGRKNWEKEKRFYGVHYVFFFFFCSLLLAQRFCRISVIELCFSDIQSNQTYQVN